MPSRREIDNGPDPAAGVPWNAGWGNEGGGKAARSAAVGGGNCGGEGEGIGKAAGGKICDEGGGDGCGCDCVANGSNTLTHSRTVVPTKLKVCRRGRCLLKQGATLKRVFKE